MTIELTKADNLRNAHRTINANFPVVDAGRRWTEDGKHGVVLEEDGRVTMLDVDGYPRTRKPTIIELSYMLSVVYRTVDEVASRLDS